MENKTDINAQAITLEEIQNFKGKYPKQLWYLFTVEMWERFCFYGMRGVLTIFMADKIMGGLGMSEKSATLSYGAIQAFVYAFTFLGGIFADKILGFKKSLTFGALMMIAGNALIAVSPTHFFYYGIALVIIGTGFFKPNISSMVGNLYKEKDPRRDAGFSLFYSGINIGALLGGIVVVWLGKSYSWSLAFLAASVVMVIGLLTFELTKKYLGIIGESPLVKLSKPKRSVYEYLTYLGAFLTIPFIYVMVKNTNYTDMFMFIVGPIAIIYFLYQLYLQKDSKVRQKLIAAFIFIFFYFVFEAFFQQAGGSLALFARNNLSHHLLFFNIDPNIVNNSSNSLFVIILSPLFGLFWLFMNKKKAEPNTVIKFGFGFFFMSLSFYIFYATRFFAGADGITSLGVFTIAYLVITIGELSLSPIGLSMITKLSPKNLGGMMMGMWFLSSAYGQYTAGILGARMTTPNETASLLEKLMAYTAGYKEIAIYSLVTGIILVIISPLVRKLMHEVK